MRPLASPPQPVPTASPQTICSRAVCRIGFSLALTLGTILTGCGTPGPPQPPSLKLPGLVTDLSAVRAGNVVTLNWTMPQKTIDHLMLSAQIHGPIPVAICRKLKPLDNCQPAGQARFAPGVEATFQDAMPASLSTGNPRQLLYYVELKNRTGAAGRSAGLSNAAMVAAGLAPSAITGLTAETRADGVALHWKSTEAGTHSVVRLHRKLLTPPTPKPAKSQRQSINSSSQKFTPAAAAGNPLPGFSGSSSEPLLRDLLVDLSQPDQAAETSKNGALDNSAKFGETYEYTAQRIERVQIAGKSFELSSDNSAPIKVNVIDTFPPAVPGGLAAVAVQTQHSIDLSWAPDSEDDLAGYIVYRTSNDAEEWTRISGSQPLPGPAYSDSNVESGHTYRYRVTAIDQTGHESKPSAETEETMPKPDGI